MGTCWRTRTLRFDNAGHKTNKTRDLHVLFLHTEGYRTECHVISPLGAVTLPVLRSRDVNKPLAALESGACAVP